MTVGGVKYCLDSRLHQSAGSPLSELIFLEEWKVGDLSRFDLCDSVDLRFAMVLGLTKDDSRVLYISNVAVGINQNIVIVVHCFVNMTILADGNVVIEAPSKSLGDLGLVLGIECRGVGVALRHFAVDFDDLAAHPQNLFDDIAVGDTIQTPLVHIDTRMQCFGSVICLQGLKT